VDDLQATQHRQDVAVRDRYDLGWRARKVREETTARGAQDRLAERHLQPVEVGLVHQHVHAVAGQLADPAHVIRMAVGADDARQLIERPPQPRDVPREQRARARQPRIDERQPVLADEIRRRAEQRNAVDVRRDQHRGSP
jgi:hypothetical protein